MTTLTQANHQWTTRPADERFTSLTALVDHVGHLYARSRAVTVSSRKLLAAPSADGRGIEVSGPNGHAYAPTHWAFGQLAQRAEAPAGYLRSLPAPLAADCLNYGFKFKRDVEDVGVLIRGGGEDEFAAVTGPNYGRIWNADIATMLVERFGDGVTGEWRVPGEFGKRLDAVTVENTTLYAGDRDMFVFLADEDRRIEVPNRRNGQPGSLARGFFVWNSEVGSATLGAAFFLFDYACKNRTIYGSEQYIEKRIRHTAGAPDRWLEQVIPVLHEYAESSEKPIQQAIAAAQEHRLGNDLDAFLTSRFSAKLSAEMKQIHEIEEGRPIESVWDVTVAATAVARGIAHQNVRVELERKAGSLLTM
jgi:hypothetical protein